MAARLLLLLGGALATVAGAAAIVVQAMSGAQPWTPELSDNFVFARSIAFAIGLGVVVGIFRGGAFARRTTRRPADGAIRRFAPGTVIGHWIMAVGVLLALPTGLWGYLGGIMDVEAPIPLYWFYRVHYIGGALILYSTASFLTYWWLSADRSLLVQRGEWRRHLLGLAHELPRRLATRLASALRVDMTQPAPPTERFTYYEKVVSFPTWTFAIALITVTGLIKALRYIYPVPGPILFWASTLHVAAMVLILLKVLDHLRYTFERWPLMVAMVTTWVSGGYARLRHPAWREAADTTVEAVGGGDA